MSAPLMIDTDVLIDHLRGQAEAVAFLSRTRRRLLVSAVTIAELHVGVRDERERAVVQRFLSLMSPVDVTARIAEVAGRWRRDYGRSHGTGLMDALIAACAAEAGATLATLNAKHFPMLEDVLVPYRKG